MSHIRQILLSCLFVLSVIFYAAAQETLSVTVAQDGSGDYKTIQEAIGACRAFQTIDKIIHIKNGIYREKVLIDSFLTHIRLVGESVENTVLTFGDYAGKENMGTFRSYSLKILGDDIAVENMTIENSAGEVGQAVALHVEGDRCIFRNCRILGNQDTLYAAGQKSRQYFSDCCISGTTDFIFGASTAIFDHCTLHSIRNSYITAASTPKGNKFGYVFLNCQLTAEPGVDKVYLGRPWRDYARVVFIDCEMGRHILQQGWHNWDHPEREKTVYYGEFNSKGPTTSPANRVGWSHQLSRKESGKYRIQTIFRQESNSWKPVEAL